MQHHRPGVPATSFGGPSRNRPCLQVLGVAALRGGTKFQAVIEGSKSICRKNGCDSPSLRAQGHVPPEIHGSAHRRSGLSPKSAAVERDCKANSFSQGGHDPSGSLSQTESQGKRTRAADNAQQHGQVAERAKLNGKPWPEHHHHGGGARHRRGSFLTH